MPTIIDVAKRAGVSPSTVSRALSGRAPVKFETKQRIMEAIKELDFKPNILAKGLKEGKTNTVGLIIPNICNPLFPAIAKGVEDEARKNGYTVFLCNTDENLSIEMDYVEKLKERWVDGLIFATVKDRYDHIEDLEKSRFPVVLLVRKYPNALHSVTLDNYEGAKMAVEYLWQRGHRRIWFLCGDTRLSLYSDRLSGYLDAVKQRGIDCNCGRAIENINTMEEAEKTLYSLLDGDRPDAIFAASDPMAIAAMRAVKSRGFRVPEDISIMGFDDLDMAAYVDPPLTTVSQPVREMGAEAFSMLLKLINRESVRPRVIKPELVIRKSVR
ncbi:LacI family DNA-binding transcriptional regulator [Caldanaerobius polysaccharolyticus]|uniref:LacI family DNA-binding transcriptional regulator n=1 Tax=Caldanaerobius polysaccharolyticus TaxID=44256 RepID=UPI000479707C|nr:LacI family DNA-binding transcriptional regulator [Caldanaerobius polysaccharolyticus]